MMYLAGEDKYDISRTLGDKNESPHTHKAMENNNTNLINLMAQIEVRYFNITFLTSLIIQKLIIAYNRRIV